MNKLSVKFKAGVIINKCKIKGGCNVKINGCNVKIKIKCEAPVLPGNLIW
jgi:hypothetical protein